MMRQAGRSLPAYRALRERYEFMDLMREPELMAEVTLMPLDVMPVDAAVLFADIMLPVASLGIEFDMAPGPVVRKPITTAEDVASLPRIPLQETVGSVFEAIRHSRARLGHTPLIGFAGSPFTVASYVIGSKRSRDLDDTRAFMYREPHAWHALMGALTDVTVEYLQLQVQAGAQAIQVFDSWMGSLGPAEYREYVYPYIARILGSVAGVPRISFGTGTQGLLEQMAEAGPDVVSVDWRTPLDVAWTRVGVDRAVQGNLDPAVLLSTPDEIRKRVADVLARAGGRPGHVFNLGHGVLPNTPLDHLKLLVDLVHG